MPPRDAPGLLLEPSDALPLVQLVFAARTGAVHDPPGKEGALSIALRALRRGAAGRPAFAIDDAIDRLGAELSTASDVAGAMVHATVLRRNLEPFLALLADVMLRPEFPPDELAQVVREASADIVDARADDQTMASRAFTRTLFAGHPFGRPSGGLLSSLAALTRDDVVAAYRATFVRDNLVAGAAGDVAGAGLERFADVALSELGDRPAPSPAMPEPTRRPGRRLVLVDKPERTQAQIYIGSLGTHPRDRDHVALTVANTVFGGAFTARLMNEVRSKRGWSYGASSRLGVERTRHAWYMHTFPAARDAGACIALQLAMLEDLLERGVTERELAQAKSYLVRGFAFERDTPEKRLMQRIEEQTTPLPRGYYAQYTERVRAVTRDEANAALRRRLTARDLVISVVATASELRGDLEKAIPGLAETRVVPFDHDGLPEP